MARTKKFPSTVIDYEGLTEEFKGLYDKIYKDFDQKNIYMLREEARQMAVVSPTTLSKENLVKRMTDKAISKYLPPEFKNEAQPMELFKDSITGERVRGVFESIGGECRIGRVSVPAALARDAELRDGDLVEGVVSEIGGFKTLVVVNSIEGELPKNRKWFADIPTSARREFGSLITGTKVDVIMPGLQMGERVIISDMTIDVAKEIVSSFPTAIGLYAGLEPENESDLAQGSFIISFDCAKAESLRVAHLALERAKRLCERGKDVVLVVYGIDSLGDRDVERALFGAGRCFLSGSLTVITDVNKDKDYGVFAKIATRII